MVLDAHLGLASSGQEGENLMDEHGQIFPRRTGQHNDALMAFDHGKTRRHPNGIGEHRSSSGNLTRLLYRWGHISAPLFAFVLQDPQLGGIQLQLHSQPPADNLPGKVILTRSDFPGDDDDVAFGAGPL